MRRSLGTKSRVLSPIAAFLLLALAALFLVSLPVGRMITTWLHKFDDIKVMPRLINTTSRPDGLEIQAPRYIHPRFFHRGQLKENAVIIFFHIPKTGGMSITDNIALSSNYQHLRAMGRRWERSKEIVDRMCSTPSSSTGRKTVLMEIHTLAPTFMKLQDQLQMWRANATANGVELFVFTLLREPVSWAVSAFNYHYRYHHISGMRDATNEALREVAQHNPQCSFLLVLVPRCSFH